MVLGIAL